MIAFVQPFGVEDPSGGGRILRALLQDAPRTSASIATIPRPLKSTKIVQEVHVSPRPNLGSWEGGRMARGFNKLLTPVRPLVRAAFARRLRRALDDMQPEVVHAIPHGFTFWFAYEYAQERGVPYVLNVHDDLRYNLAGNSSLPFLLDCFGKAWRGADARIVISEAMGQAYQKEFGDYPFTVITDGIPRQRLAPGPRTPPDGPLTVYFMGSMHLSYHPNARALGNALDALAEKGIHTRYLSRGSGVPFETAHAQIEKRPFAPESVVQKDLDEVHILYLPLPFGEQFESFTRYSLSTKMITYLGSGRPMLYHGPETAAAGQLLQAHGAAQMVTSLDVSALANALQQLWTRPHPVAENALALGRTQFALEDIRARFWKLIKNLNSFGLRNSISR